MSMNFDEMVDSQEKTAPAKRGLSLELRRRPEYVVAGLPTVSLLPRELKAAARDKSVRRMLVAGVVAAFLVAGGATAGATLLNSAAQSRLDTANDRSQALVGQLAKFSDVQKLQADIVLGSAGKQVGESTEIDWQAQMDAIEADMPSGYSIATVTADSASAVAAYPQGSTPLEQPRAASLSLTVTTPTITQLPIWLRKLRSIPAYADATATVSSTSSSTDTTSYSVALTIHLSPKALVHSKAKK